MDNTRSSRLADFVRATVGKHVMTIPPNVAMGVSITQVKVTSDFQYADVFISAMKGVDAALKYLKIRNRDIRKELAKQVTTYAIPQIRYSSDSRGEELSKLDDLLSSLG